MALVERYVDPDISGGLGDGTSWANAYASLNEWDAAEATDLVTAGDSHKVWCRSSSGSADTASVSLTTWGTGSGNTVTITAAEGHRAGTSWDTDKYRLEISTANDSLYFNEDWFIVDGLQIGNTTTTNDCVVIGILRDNITVKNCFIKGGRYGILSGTSGTRQYRKIENCIVFDTADDAIRGGTGFDNTNHIYNCTVYGSGDLGINPRDSDVVVKNCISMGNASSDFINAAGDYNISGDTTAPGTNSLESRTATDNASPGTGDWVVFADLTAGSEDFALQNVAENDAIGAGTDLSAYFTDDIDGDTRSNWDIGADEYVATATFKPFWALNATRISL